MFLAYTKTVDSAFRVLLLATQSRDIQCYSLIHLQLLRASGVKLVKVTRSMVSRFTVLHEKFFQFDWLIAVVFQLHLKYLHVEITKPLRVIV